MILNDCGPSQFLDIDFRFLPLPKRLELLVNKSFWLNTILASTLERYPERVDEAME